MPLSTDISTALHLLEQVQERVEDDPKLQMHTSQDLKSLISLLEDPVFRSIVTIQDSLIELNTQLTHHPSILPGDFDINISGQLELSVPSTPVQPLGPNMYQDLYQDSSELEDQRVPVAPLLHSSSEDTSAQVTSPSLASEVMGMPPITTPTYAKEFKKVIEAAARGRQIFTVQLYKPEGTSLGFSVVGLRSKDKGELGIFLQEIQPNGIAGCDGRLVEGDQILAIDGQPLDSNISHEQAISILQKARGLVELVVARSTQDVGSSLPTDELSGGSSSTAAAGAASSIVGGGGGAAAGNNQTSSDKDQSVSASSTIVTPGPTPKSSQPTSTTSAATPTPTHTPTPTPTSTPIPGGLVIERSPSAVSDASKSGSDMVLNTEWAQVEVINLINDGSGLGFGIIGGRSTGVVVKTILPGGVADRDNRLQSGDHILQIGDVNLRGMGSEQVAAVLRQSGTHVRLVVARPVEPTSPDYQALGSHAPIVPTKILGDPDELDRHLVHSVPESYNMRHVQGGDTSYDNGYMYSQESDIEMHARPGLIMDVVRNPMPIGAMPVIPAVPLPVQLQDLPVLTMEPLDINSLPEMERFTVNLTKDIYGLGITIAGYVCEKEELSGIFVKSISEGSAADLSKMIQINDRIVEVDGHSLQGYTNHEAVEVLRRTGQTVNLCLERYLRGPKFEQLQQAIAASELRLPQPSSPSITSLPSFPMSADGETTTEIEPEGESHTTVDSAILQEGERLRTSDEQDEATNVEALLSDPSSELTPQIRAAIKAKWQKIVGPDTEIVVAQLKKFAEGSGLGISLEGTVDVENGQEVRPHHYIRSILPEGPVGQNGTLRSGDELLEVNGYRLLGINHMEVVSVLKELPIHVRMVCGRNIASQDPLCPIDTAQHQAAFQTRSILGGSLQNLLPTMDRLVKAKSDGSLASTTTTATVTDASLNKMKSRSLEPLTGLAMWSSEPQIIELVKGERGLGFSILDYQDPMNPNETVIVIRSLVPGGVAQVDGQLIPGDRLLFVNDIGLENATLDQAVQALKGAPKGTVRIGVAKPLPIPDSIVQQKATPKMKRSKSFPNECETTDRVAELEDLLSSRSGLTETSTNKPEVDEDEEEEEDHWKDASPVTPICSPARPPPLGKLRHRDKQSPTRYVDIDNDVEIIHEFYPTTSKTMHEETSIVSYGGTIIVETTRIPRHIKDVAPRMEKVAPKVKLKKQSSLELESSRVPPVQEEPLSSAEKASRITATTRSQREVDEERKKTLKRHSSVDSEGRTSTSKETLEKSDTSSEKGARKKVFTEKEDGRKRSKKSGRRSVKTEQKLEEDSERNLESLEKEELKKKDGETYRRSREERKSLKEEECIERVTEFLTRHSIPTYSDMSVNLETMETSVSENVDEQRVKRPSVISKDGETASPSTTVEPSIVSTKRKGSLKSVPEMTKETKDFLEDSRVKDTEGSLESKKQRSTLERASAVVSDVQQTEPAVQKPVKRPSSMRKRRDSFSRESSRESLLEEKKGVRIQEDVQEIFFEDMSEQVDLLPEVQLVTARIITAEEASALRFEEAVTRIEIHSPPEVAVVAETVKTKLTRAPSPEIVDVSSLQLPTLAKSTSESTLTENKPDANEDHKVSVRNLKPEILWDLSKVSDNGEEIEETVEGDRDIKERRLSRTGSEGSKRLIKSQKQEQFPFKISSLAQPDRPELTILHEGPIEKASSVGDITGKIATEDAEKDDSITSIQVRRESKESVGVPKDLAIPPSEVATPAQELQREKEQEEPSSRQETKEDTKESRDYGQTPSREKRSPLLEELVCKHEEDNLICKEHSLEYQSQTLESQSDHLFHEVITSSLEDLLKTVPESWTREVYEESLDEVEHSFKETQYSPKEKRDVQTQTVQESKGTQCSPEQSVTTPCDEEQPSISPFHVSRKYFQSPKREVQTQTQGENKSVQCSLDDLGDLANVAAGSSIRSDQTQESKSVQCIPEDLSARSFDRSRSSSREDVLRSPRREVEVQTYQESKAIQCSDDELLEADQSTDRSDRPHHSRPASSTSRKTESSPSSSSSSPRKFPTVVFVEGKGDMTVTHRERDGDVTWSKHWGPERLVEIYREPKTSLGLSIVGGKVDLHNGSSSKSQNISGIFIKNVLPNSPAGRTGGLKIGDRIIEVDGVDLRHSTHERAVEVIQAAGNPVCLVVQSLVHLSPEHGSAVQEERDTKARRQTVKSHTSPSSGISSGTPTASFRRKPPPVSPARSITPEVIQPGLEDGDTQSSSRGDSQRPSSKSSDGSASSSRRSSMKKSIRKTAPSPPVNPGILREVSEEREDHTAEPATKPKYSSDESSDDEEDTRMLEGNVYTKSGVEISRKSAGNVRRTKAEIEADPEEEDEFGYTANKVQKKYQHLGHKVLMVILEKDRRGLGISLAGHKDRNRMAVFICGLNPKGAAHKNGGLLIGDEILEVNGCVLQGRCHLNASALIKGIAGNRFKIIVYRRSKAVDDIAVKPIVQFPPTLDDNFASSFSKYKGVREIQIKKSPYGLGIMIIEGKHLAVGQGIFVSDIQDGSAAEQAGLKMGDMILAVNLDSLIGRTYDEATELLKKAQGVVVLTVCNPNENKVEQKEEQKEKDKTKLGGEAADVAQKTPQKSASATAKEAEKLAESEKIRLDPKTCQIPVGQEVTIEFQKEKDQVVGIVIAGGSDTLWNGVFVLDVFPEGAAGKDGRLKLGDQILSIGSESFKQIESHKARETMLKLTSGTIMMTVLRHEKPTEEYEVEIQKKSGRGAGICFAAFRSGKGAYVTELMPGGQAIETGKICKGDHLITISGLDVREVSFDDIAFHLKISNPLQLKLARYKSAKQ
ncbi:inaD-like protein isoform X1 [Formica exsecta]|uniref:inaD-like protein isoform X1 n=1 Tax=Formica exsecta TaxID=72781 RepID=UPI001144BB15|nr:inaD-like protein isoform X1 [Formica exsecta]